MANLVTGPVVGVVDETNYRLLVEIDETQPIVVEIEDLDGGGEPSALSVRATARRPIAVPLAGLVPGHRYRATVVSLEERPVAEFRAIDASKRIRIGVVSCNDAGYKPKEVADDVWADVADAVEAEEIDLLVHAGDQIYADDLYADAMMVDYDPLDRVAENYRARYRETWRPKSVRRALRGVPNLMVWDDHEVTDHFGDLPQHRDGAEKGITKKADREAVLRARAVAETAWNVYREYETPLHAGSAPGDPFGHEGHGHVFGPVAIYLLDVRGGRAFQRDAQRPYLSTAQWNAFVKFINKAKDARVLVVCAPAPVAFLGPEWTDAHEGAAAKIAALLKVGSPWPEDLRGHWSYKEYAKEQRLILDALDRWQSAQPGRKALLLGGDVHVGCTTTIYRVDKQGNKTPILDQLVASSISYRLLEGIKFWAFGAMLKNPEKGMLWNGSFRWEHSDLVWDHNFGIATITMGKKPSIALQIRT